MKRLSMLLMCLAAMLAAGTSLKAQEITITLSPGMNWISYPNVEVMDITSALGVFAPVEGDKIVSQSSSSTFSRNVWRGGVTQFVPGCGYMYYSNRTETVSFVFAHAASSTLVNTTMPSDITISSATCGGEVTDTGNSAIVVHGLCWGTEPNPTVAGPHTSGDFGTGSFSHVIDSLEMNTTYYVRAYALTENGMVYGNEQSFTTENGGSSDDHEYVDLGLPSGLLWATCNVGADNPEDYGDYFAWGETDPKNIYNWSTYQYCNGGDGWNMLTKYCSKSNYGYNGFTDNLTTLLPEDDVAIVNWGSDWRMPTKEEFQELYNNTTVTWTQQNGVNGRLFTASNGNSLFLPAAGSRDYSYLYNAGDGGDYWSSSLNTGYPSNAWYFHFASGGYSMDNALRPVGFSVRPVRSGEPTPSFMIDATSNPAEGGTVAGGGTYGHGQSCTVHATANTGYTFANWTEGGEVVSTDAIYTFTVNADRILVANFIYNGGGNHAYVDLGLPSGLLWATCNIGASSPEDYGDYFAWGETQPKDTYTLDNYQYYGSVNPITLTKYCNNPSYGYNGFADNLTTLLPEDDAATANWGSDWRMPTEEECRELYQNTTNTWTTQNGVYGLLFTASNGNSLFLPAAGCRSDGNLINAVDHGNYWSSSIYTDIPHVVWKLYFSYEHYYDGIYYDNRNFGFPVRPVRSSRQN